MSRHRRKRSSPAAAAPSAASPAPLPPGLEQLAGGAQPVLATPNGLYSIGGNGYQGAEFSPQRGYVYFPQLDTRRELDSYTHTELFRRGRFLYANVGLVRRIVKGMARMVVGTGVIPQATTPDEEWNRNSEEAFALRYESAPVWDVGGRFTGYDQQLVMMQRRYLDGDIAKAYVSAESGRARTALYEAHQIGNRGDLGDQADRWFNGVYTDRNNRALKYRILGEGESFRDLLPEDLVFFADYESSGQNRGLTILAHAINNLIDVTEIRSWLKHGIKISSQLGYYLAAKDPNVRPGVQAVLGPQNVRTEGEAPNKIRVEDVVGGSGRVIDIGYRELKTLLDERPHPNSAAFLEDIVRDVSWGAGVAPEVIWNMAALGGANTRFVLADAQGFIEQQQDKLITTSLRRDWHITIAKEIKYADFPEPRVNGRTAPGSWLGKVSFIPPKRVTVDYGRDGGLMLEQLESGALTHERWFAMLGQDAREETRKELEFRAWRRDEAARLNFDRDPFLKPNAKTDDDEDDSDDEKKR